MTVLNPLISYTMVGQLTTATGVNAWQSVYWTVQNVPDYTGQYSGYFGQLQNIQIATTTTNNNPVEYVIPTSPAGGDLIGNYPNPTINSIQGIIISGTAQDGYVLTSLSPTSATWSPVVYQPVVSLSGDVDGYSNSNIVTSLTGSSGNLTIGASNLLWTATVSPLLSQSSTSGSTGTDLVIASQSSAGTPGNIVLRVPLKTGSGHDGYVVYESGTVPLMKLGTFNNSTTASAIWLGANATTAPSNVNFTIYSDGYSTQINAPSTIFTTINSINSQKITEYGIQLFGNNTYFGGGQGVLGITNAVTPPSGTITNGICIYSQNGDGYVINSAGTVVNLFNTGNFTAGGDLSGTSSSQTVVGIDGYATSLTTLTKGQFLMATTASTVGNVSLSGDISDSATTAGKLTVNAISGPLVLTNVISVNFGTSPYNVASTDQVILIDSSGGNVTVNLPGSPAVGRIITVQCSVYTGSILINGSSGGGVYINGFTSYALIAQYKYVTVVWNGTAWQIIGNN